VENIREGLLETLEQVSEMKSHIVNYGWNPESIWVMSFEKLVEALVARLPLMRLRHLVVSMRTSTSIFSLMSHGYKGMDLAWAFTQSQVAQSVASRILIQRSWVRTYPGCDKKWKSGTILRQYVENILEGLLETLEKVSEMKSHNIDHEMQ
jgi:hypothetical protein